MHAVDDSRRFLAFCERFGLDGSALAEYNEGKSDVWRYGLTGPDDLPQAIRISTTLRFGNYVAQLTHALFLAEVFGIRTVFLDSDGPLQYCRYGVHGGIDIRSNSDFSGFEGTCFSGHFFGFGQYMSHPLKMRYDERFTALSSELVRPLLGLGEHPFDPMRVAVHIRSGDIFEGDGENEGYTQPPLAYYVQAIADLLEEEPERHIVLLYENKYNPVINLLEAHLRRRNVRFQPGTGSLRSDIEDIISAGAVVSSFGTFCPSIVLLGGRTHTYCAFRRKPWSILKLPVRIWLYEEDGTYTPQQDWRNSPEQVAALLTYPAEGLTRSIIEPDQAKLSQREARTGRRIDLARGKPAKQSSTSVYSTINDAQGAVNGCKTGRFSFHTEEEDDPWWEVDLVDEETVSEIVIFNRNDCCEERASSLRVLVREDRSDWDLVHDQNGVTFGGASDNAPLRIILPPRRIRHLRLQLTGRAILHLDEVEVYAPPSETSSEV